MTLTPREDVRRVYDESADSYSHMMDLEIQLPIYDELLGKLAAKIGLVKGSILDLSCGSGHMLERLHKVVAPGRKLIGVDLSPRMVEISKTRLGTSANVFECDMVKLAQVGDGHCAAAFSFLTVHHIDLDELECCLDEWNRVLVMGGYLLLATWEGKGEFSFGGAFDVVTRKYAEHELVNTVATAGFHVDDYSVQPIGDLAMNVVHLFARKIR